LPGQRVPFLPCRQGTVPHHAHAAERARQDRLLRLVGVRPAPVGRPHLHSRPHMGARTWQAHRTGFLPTLNGRASAGELGDRVP
jgi:hypothetical protein